MHSDMGGFADDEIVGLRGARRNNGVGPPDVPRVVDTTAEILGERFEKFLEGCVEKGVYTQVITNVEQLHGRSDTVCCSDIERGHHEQILHCPDTWLVPIQALYPLCRLYASDGP